MSATILTAFIAARPANTQCADSHCPGSTQAPTFALIALVVVAVLFVVLAIRMWRRGRHSGDAVLGASAAVLAGLGVLCLVLFGSGFRHFGGTAPSGGAACQAWWQEAGLPSAAQGVGGDAGAVDCQQRAVDAIGPALGEGGVAGLVVGGVVFGTFWYTRHRAERPRRTSRYAYSDLAPDPHRPDE